MNEPRKPIKQEKGEYHHKDCKINYTASECIDGSSAWARIYYPDGIGYEIILNQKSLDDAKKGIIDLAKNSIDDKL